MTEDFFAKAMRSLSILKRRNDDDLAGELRLRLYWRKLCHLPEGAIRYMVDKALERLDWFPTIHECLTIAVEWTPPADGARARMLALAAVQREDRLRFDDVMDALKRRELDQSAIDKLPEVWRVCGETAGYLWRWPDGRYTVRRESLAASAEDIERCRAEARAWSEAWDQWAAEQREASAA